MMKRITPPNLVLAQRAMDKMAAAASQFLEDETGEAMVGLRMPGTNTNGIPTIYVLDTISPDESAVRHLHTFQQGDGWQDELIWWLQENWKVERDQHGKNFKWNAPLRYLGDWHKQPGFMIQPSGGDLQTALDWLDDETNDMESLLVPIVTLGHPPTLEVSSATVNYVTCALDDGSLMRVDWWFIHRDVRMFQPINPVVYPDDQLPCLVQYPWHIVDEARTTRELTQFQKEGWFVSVVLWNVDDKLPLEVCLLVARQGSSKVILMATAWDFPQSSPQAWTAPFVAMGPDDDMYDVFKQLWGQRTPVGELPGWTWSPEKSLLDYAQAIEKHLGLYTPSVADDSEKAAENLQDVEEPHDLG